MKREEVQAIFENATEDQLNRLMALNGADITREQNKYKPQLDKANADLEEARNALKELQEASGDVEEIRRRLQEFESAEAERQENERRAAEETELKERFSTVTGEKQFVHDYVRKGVMDDFGKALKDKANRGKSDAEIFDALTKDRDYFKSQNPPAENMGGASNRVNESELDKLSDAEYYARIFDKK